MSSIWEMMHGDHILRLSTRKIISKSMNNFGATVSRLKTETLLLVGVLPFAGWIVAFCFEQGYLSHFGFSYDFVEIGLTQTMAASLILFGLAYIFGSIALISEPFYSLNKTWRERRRDIWSLTILLLGIMIAILFVTSGNRITLVSTVAVFFTYICAVYILHVLSDKIKRAIGRNVVYVHLFESLQRVLRSKPAVLILIVAFIVLLLSLIATFGKRIAADKIELMTLEDAPNYVLVRRYGDTYLFRQIDRKKRYQMQGVKTLKAGDGKEINMRLEYLGPIEEY